MTPYDVSRVLSDLAETVSEGADGYRRVAKVADDPALAEMFVGFASKREKFAKQLHSLEVEFCPPAGCSKPLVPTPAARGWDAPVSQLENADSEAILGTCLEGENRTLESFEDALAIPLPESVLAVIRPQAREIESAYKRLNRMQEMSCAA